MTDINYSLTHLFHPRGPKIDIPISLTETLTLDDAFRMMQSVDNLLEAGFLVAAPGLEAGEVVEDVGWVLRKKQKNEHGESIRMELYPVSPVLVKKLLHYYLDAPEQIAEFEAACGVKVSTLPVYMGRDSVVRGADAETDRFVVRLPRPATVVWKENPNYDPDETDTSKKKPRRLFVRWANLRPAMQTDYSAVKTPGGLFVKDLDTEKLTKLSTSTAENVTADMREAAKYYLNHSF